MLTNTGPCPFLALLVLPREKAMAPRSTTLASEIPRMEEPGAGYCPWGRKESGMTERLPFPFPFL